MIQWILLLTFIFPIVSIVNSQEVETIKIGNQVWMSANIDSVVIDSYCFNNDTSNCHKYGRLFNWETALSICPDGFHLPSDDEWKELTDTLGGLNRVGQKLKRGGTSEFEAPLGGNFNKGLEIFSYSNEHGYFWTSTPFNKKAAWFRQIGEKQTNINRSTVDKEYFFSVRCIKSK